MRLGLLELLVILVLVVLIIGPRQIPKLTETFSSSIKKFKSEFNKEEEVSDEESTS